MMAVCIMEDVASCYKSQLVCWIEPFCVHICCYRYLRFNFKSIANSALLLDILWLTLQKKTWMMPCCALRIWTHEHMNTMRSCCKNTIWLGTWLGFGQWRQDHRNTGIRYSQGLKHKISPVFFILFIFYFFLWGVEKSNHVLERNP